MQPTEKSRIIIVGAGGSGKDLLKKRFVDKGYIPDVSYTSRAPRIGEEDGKDYHFVSPDRFESLIKEGFFFEHKEFNGWKYGTTQKAFQECDIFIMTPPAVDQLPVGIRRSSFVVLITIEEWIRAKRLSARNDADNVKRRLTADEEMFKGWSNCDLIVDNPLF